MTLRLTSTSDGKVKVWRKPKRTLKEAAVQMKFGEVNRVIGLKHIL